MVPVLGREVEVGEQSFSILGQAVDRLSYLAPYFSANTSMAASAATRIGAPTVFVIDDDESMCRRLTNLFESVRLRVEAFGSAPELLQRRLLDVPGCLVLDIGLPGMSGLDFQLLRRGHGRFALICRNSRRIDMRLGRMLN
jgi:PleD family two-component response regulator